MMIRFSIGLIALLLLPSAAHSQMAEGLDKAALIAVRIGVRDPDAAAQFYRHVFKLQEIQRVEQEGETEVVLNFGSSVAEAKASKEPKLVLRLQEMSLPRPSLSNVILRVDNLDATIDRVMESGGSLAKRFPLEIGAIAMIRDPDGNEIELVARPSATP